MKTTGLSFSEAVKAAMDGKKIRRAAWIDPQLTAYADSGWLYMESPDCPAKHVDVSVDATLADDWEIVPEPPKTMGFMEAWEQAKQGKKIARLSFENYSAKIIDDCLITTFRNGVQSEMNITTAYIDATDWYVVEEDVSHD